MRRILYRWLGSVVMAGAVLAISAMAGIPLNRPTWKSWAILGVVSVVYWIGLFRPFLLPEDER